MNIEKVERLVANLRDKEQYITHTQKFKVSIKAWMNSA